MNISKHIACAAVFVAITATSQLGAAVVNITQGSTSGYTMTDGNTYVVQKSVSFNSSIAGESGMTVAEGATVVLYVPQGVILTAKGGAGSDQTGGGAGIRVPETATLVITGEGVVSATGGKAGNGNNGANGGDGDAWAYWPMGSTKPPVIGGTGGSGGSGGSGGGGAGAGIGGQGGTGGGSGGNIGKNGQTMGTVYVLGTMTIHAYSGSIGSSGNSGLAGKTKTATLPAGDYPVNYNTAKGYGGGGGGRGIGGGIPTCAIGGGGGGGGGGQKGGNGYGGPIGLYYEDPGAPANGGNAASGSVGGQGNLYVSSSASVNVTRSTSYTTTHPAARYSITFNPDGGTLSSSASSTTATLGCKLPLLDFIIPAPTKEWCEFLGWSTERKGGSLWYGPDGEQKITAYPIAGDVTLYALWSSKKLAVQAQYGTPSPEVGLHDCETGSTIDASVAPPEATDGVRFNYLGWTGTGSVPASGTATNMSFVITEDSTLIWNWERLNRITILTSLDGECGFGAQWILNGQTASATLTPPEGRYDLELVGDTNGVSISGVTLSITSDAPKTIDAKMYSWNRLVGTIPWHDAELPFGWSVASDASSEDGYSLHSAFAETGTASTNSATLHGPGILTFNWRISANRGDYARLFVDGIQKAQITRKPEWTAVSVNIEEGGDHLVSWVYERKSTTAANDNAAYIDDVSWMSVGAETSTTPTPVPHNWLEGEASSILAKNGGKYEDAANATAANRENKVWECYVAGISPTNETAKFEARIEIDDNGKPEVSWLPKLPPEEESKRIYRILGTKTLELGAQWSDVTSLVNPDAEGYRFFKVSVEIPN